jgi:hypothetical protein
MGSNLFAHIGVRRGSTAALVAVALGAAAFSLAGPSDGSSPPPKGSAASTTGAPIGDPFFRAVYDFGGTRLAPAQEGLRYRVMILQETDAVMIPRLKARNPGLKVLMYVDMMGADKRDPKGLSDWVGFTEAEANPDWFLLDSAARQLVFKNYPTGRVMDVGNTAYQNAGAARVAATAKAQAFDGVFLDDANASLRWVIAGGASQCVKYPTDAAWQAAVYSFFQNVAPQLQSAGLIVVANIGGSTITPGLWQKWNGPIDGAMEESFTNGGAGRDSIANGQWPAKLGHALWSETHGKIALDHAVTAARGGARYGLATMLLVAGGRNLFSATRSPTREVWWPEYTTANALGRPLGRYRRLRNGAYRRDFTHGVVLVNPHAKGARVVRLGATYHGSGLGSTRSVTLKPKTGAVLVRS